MMAWAAGGGLLGWKMVLLTMGQLVPAQNDIYVRGPSLKEMRVQHTACTGQRAGEDGRREQEALPTDVATRVHVLAEISRKGVNEPWFM